MISRHLDCHLDESANFQYFLIVVFNETQDYASATLAILSRLCSMQLFHNIQNWKFISRLRFEDVKDIRRNMTVQLYTILKIKSFRGALINGKLTGIRMFKCQRDNFEE